MPSRSGFSAMNALQSREIEILQVTSPSQESLAPKAIDIVVPPNTNIQVSTIANVRLLRDGGIKKWTTSNGQALLALPAARAEPALREGREDINLNKGEKSAKTNREAYFAQIAGKVSPRQCDRCANKKGRWTECIVVEGFLNGSCGNCHYGSEGKRCSLRRKNNAGSSNSSKKQSDATRDVKPLVAAEAGPSFSQRSNIGSQRSARTKDGGSVETENSGDESTLLAVRRKNADQNYPDGHHLCSKDTRIKKLTDTVKSTQCELDELKKEHEKRGKECELAEAHLNDMFSDEHKERLIVKMEQFKNYQQEELRLRLEAMKKGFIHETEIENSTLVLNLRCDLTSAEEALKISEDHLADYLSTGKELSTVMVDFDRKFRAAQNSLELAEVVAKSAQEALESAQKETRYLKEQLAKVIAASQKQKAELRRDSAAHTLKAKGDKMEQKLWHEELSRKEKYLDAVKIRLEYRNRFQSPMENLEEGNSDYMRNSEDDHGIATPPPSQEATIEIEVDEDIDWALGYLRSSAASPEDAITSSLVNTPGTRSIGLICPEEASQSPKCSPRRGSSKKRAGEATENHYAVSPKPKKKSRAGK